VTPLAKRQRILVLAICCMSLLIVGLDNTIVNVALPSIGRDLHASVSGLQWTVDAYTLVLASLLMLSGSTGDRLGRRRVFRTGLVLFTLGSLLCSVAPGLGLLVTFRMVQAVGGSMLNPVAMSIITNVFTDPRERAAAIGVWGGVIGVSMALGPVLGGVLVGSVGWRSIFWINVPVGIAALVLTTRYVPESRAERPRRVDPVGQALLLTVLASLTYAIIEVPSAGWTSARIVAAFALSAAGVVAFVRHERRREEPLLDMRFFGSVPFSGAVVLALTGFVGLGGFLFLNTLYLQESRGLSALQAGLYTLPMAAMTVVFGPLSGRLVGRYGPRSSLVIAGCAVTASTLMLTGITATTPRNWLFAAYVLFGLGFGLVNTPITNTAISGMPRTQAGVAAAVASTSRQVGQSLGVAVVGAIANSGLRGGLTAGLARATHPGWWLIAGCGVAIAVGGMLTTTRRAGESAARVAAALADEPGPATVARGQPIG
jgi:EmrB/QacA subfamily drug resistance transporter